MPGSAFSVAPSKPHADSPSMNDNGIDSRFDESDEPADAEESGWLAIDIGLLVFTAALWIVTGVAITVAAVIAWRLLVP